MSRASKLEATVALSEVRASVRYALRRRIKHPRIHRIEDFGRLGYGIHFRLYRPADIDARMIGFMREAYASVRAGA